MGTFRSSPALTLLSEPKARVMHLRRMDQSDQPQRRGVSATTLNGREAARLVRDINEKIGAWQTESVRLATAAERMKQSARHEPAIIEAIVALIGIVERQQMDLASTLVSVPAGVAEHSRVADTKQALRMIVDRLKNALAK